MMVNKHKGLYRYNRLAFGTSAAPATFQRTIEGVLWVSPNVCVYIDDILVTGETEKEHLETHKTGSGRHASQTKQVCISPVISRVPLSSDHRREITTDC